MQDLEVHGLDGLYYQSVATMTDDDAPRLQTEKSFFFLESESVKMCPSPVLPHEISAQNCAGFEAKQKSKSSWTHSNPGTWKRCRFLKWKTDGLPRTHGSAEGLN